EEIARATRRIEHAKLPKIGKRFTQFTDVLSRGVDALAPRPNNCRPDHFANVELARKMRAERVAFIASHLFALLVAAGVHAILEQRAENLWAYMRPIFRGRFAKAVCFGALELNRIDHGKQSAVEILNVDESTARRLALGRHQAKEPAD